MQTKNTGHAELKQPKSKAMPTLGNGKTIGISNLASAGLSSTLALEASNANQPAGKNLPMPPRDGMFVPGGGVDALSISTSSAGGPKKRSKDDSALTRSGYRVLDGMAAVGSNTMQPSTMRKGSDLAENANALVTSSSKEKSKKKKLMKASNLSKGQRSRSQVNPDKEESSQYSSLSREGARPDSLPQL